MKRDMDLVRKIMLAVEASERPLDSSLIRIAGYTPETITEHMRLNKNDHSSRRGLMAMVNRRKRLLRYLSEENRPKYLEIAEAFGIRGVKA